MYSKTTETFTQGHFLQIQFDEPSVNLLLLVLQQGQPIKKYSSTINFNDDSILSQILTASSFYELTKLPQNYEVDSELGVLILKCQLIAVNFKQKTNLKFTLKIDSLNSVESLQYEVLFYKKKLCQMNLQDEPIQENTKPKGTELPFHIEKIKTKTQRQKYRQQPKQIQEKKKDQSICKETMKSKKIRKQRTKKNETESKKDQKIKKDQKQIQKHGKQRRIHMRIKQIENDQFHDKDTNEKSKENDYSLSKESRKPFTIQTNEETDIRVFQLEKPSGGPAKPIQTIHLEDNKYIFRFHNGDVYEGQVLNLIYHGFGCYTSSHLGSYKGNWNNGKFQGQGVSVDNDGNRYEGNFSNDMKNGKGKQTFINGEVYQGEYENGVKSGYGIYYFLGGERYQGEWKNDVFEGKGKFIKSDGSYEEGMWSNDEQIGNFIKVDKQGKILHVKKVNELGGSYVKIQQKDIELVN